MCPASATITSFFVFTPGTKAKASEVNTDLQTWRGHIIPVNTDTATGSDNTHDLGATDHRWRRIYLGEPPYVNGSQLGKIPVPCVFDGSVATDRVNPIDDLELVGFPTSGDTEVKFSFVVPSEYKPGNRIGLTFRGFSETTGSTIFHSLARLYRMGTTQGNSAPSAILTSTATFSNSVAGLFMEDSTLKLTDASGLINGTTVTVGNLISVNLKRSASSTGDTNAGYMYLSELVVDLNN